MRYVMVPVPSEFVRHVMEWVLFRTPDESEEGAELQDRQRLSAFLEDADEAARALLVLVAQATNDGSSVRFTDAVEALEQDSEALDILLLEINSAALGDGRDLIRIATEPAVRVHGNIGQNRYLTMRPEHARAIRVLTALA